MGTAVDLWKQLLALLCACAALPRCELACTYGLLQVARVMIDTIARTDATLHRRDRRVVFPLLTPVTPLVNSDLNNDL
jgi:hypothetical protein